MGHAIWCARDIVGNEPFAVLLPDVITQCPGLSCLSQLIEVYGKEGGNHVAIEQVDPNDVSQYGIVALANTANNARKITAMIEKPTVESAPSNLSIVGRYILQPEIFGILENCSAGVNGEIQLTDAMRKLMELQEFFGIEYDGRSFDCGSKIGFLTANIALALSRPDLADEFKDKLIELIPEAGIDASRIIVGLMHGAPRGRSRLRLVG